MHSVVQYVYNSLALLFGTVMKLFASHKYENYKVSLSSTSGCSLKNFGITCISSWHLLMPVMFMWSFGCAFDASIMSHVWLLQGLDVIESTNLKYFPKDMTSEFYALKGMFLSQIGR